MKLESFKQFKIPDKSGVYFFLKGSDILYIGKATSLKSRVRSYFSGDLIRTRGQFLVDLISRADKIDWRETDSVLEALILEANLIKKYKPHFNTREKDDKSYLCVVITKEPLPRVFAVRSRNLKERSNILENVRISKSYGPFTSGPQLREALRIIRRIFPFLDEKSTNYLEFYRQLNLAPDLGNRKLYLQNIRNIKLFFSGRKNQIFINLKKEMKEYAKAQQFEKASEIKRQLFTLQHINDISLLKNSSLEPRTSNLEPNFRIEAYDIAHMGGKNMVGVMTMVENNNPVKNEYKKFKIRTQSDTNDTGALREILERRLNHMEWVYPNLIVVDGGIAQLNAAKNVLVERGLNIPIVALLKNERHKPKDILGDKESAHKYKSQILLANSEAHRFAIAYHKNMRNRNFLR